MKMHVNRKLSLRHLQMEEVLKNVVLSPLNQCNKMWFSFAWCFLRGSGSVCCPWMVVTGSWRQQRLTPVVSVFIYINGFFLKMLLFDKKLLLPVFQI